MALGQLASRAMNTDRKRVLFTVLGVTAVVALLVVVTGMGLGLAMETTVYDEDVDYWIVPDAGGEDSPLVATDGPAFSDAHETATDLETHPDIEYASPIATEVLRLEHDDRSEYVLVVGVVSTPGIGEIVGLDAGALTPNDPFHDGDTRTGELVLSETGASLLEADEDDTIEIDGEESVSVVAVDDGRSAGGANMPVALVHLSELQAMTGGEEADLADQFVVGTTDPAVKDDLEDVYPQSTVYTREGLLATETMDGDLSLALSLTAFVVAISIGTLFVVTTMGLELLANRREFATLSALGVSTVSQFRLVGIQTVVLTAVGGFLGGVAGYFGVHLVNELAMAVVTSGPIALVSPLLIGYGLLAALVIGLVSIPILLAITRRLSRGAP